MENRYRTSGLDNVFLANLTAGDEGGDNCAIPDSAGLHRAIGSWLISLRRGLTGAEVRFLRIEMGLTQRTLGELLGATVQTVRHWEKHRGKEVNGAADRLLRLLYSEAIAGRSAIRSKMTSLLKGTAGAAREVVMRKTPIGWTSSAVLPEQPEATASPIPRRETTCMGRRISS